LQWSPFQKELSRVRQGNEWLLTGKFRPWNTWALKCESWVSHEWVLVVWVSQSCLGESELLISSSYSSCFTSFGVMRFFARTHPQIWVLVLVPQGFPLLVLLFWGEVCFGLELLFLVSSLHKRFQIWVRYDLGVLLNIYYSVRLKTVIVSPLTLTHSQTTQHIQLYTKTSR